MNIGAVVERQQRMEAALGDLVTAVNHLQAGQPQPDPNAGPLTSGASSNSVLMDQVSSMLYYKMSNFSKMVEVQLSELWKTSVATTSSSARQQQSSADRLNNVVLFGISGNKDLYVTAPRPAFVILTGFSQSVHDLKVEAG